MKNYKQLFACLLITSLASCSEGNSKELATTEQNSNPDDSEYVGPPSIDDKSQSSSKIGTLAVLGGEGVGLVLSLWSASKVEKLADVLYGLNDPTSKHLSSKLHELANSQKAYNIVKASLANDVNGSMTPALKANYEILSEQHRSLSTLLKNQEISLANANAQLELLKSRKYNLEDAWKMFPSKTDATLAKTNFEEKITQTRANLAQVETKIAELFRENAKLYPTYRKYLLSKKALQRALLSLDVTFSKMLSASLLRLASFHTPKIKYKFSKRSKSKFIDWNSARITYITASGFMVAGIGYTLWTTLSDAESDGNKLVLDVKEIFESEDFGDYKNETNKE